MHIDIYSYIHILIYTYGIHVRMYSYILIQEMTMMCLTVEHSGLHLKYTDLPQESSRESNVGIVK